MADSIRQLARDWRTWALGNSAPAVRRADLARAVPSSTFLRGMGSPFLWGWSAALREPADEYRDAWLEGTTRAIDALHNSGWLAGGVRQAVNMICGPQMALNSKPSKDIFGGDATATALWARRVEQRFNAWATNPYACDLTGRQSLGQMTSRATQEWFGTGEIAGLVQYRKREGNVHGTKIQILPSNRIPQASGKYHDTVQGVRLDRDGYPLAYVFANPDARDPGKVEEVLVQARDRYGRLTVIHIHDSPATVVRGLTCLAPILNVLKQYDQLANATLTAALIQAIFAATIESNAPTTDVLNMLQTEDEQSGQISTSGFDGFMSTRAEWYKGTKFDLGELGKILHLFPNEKLNLLRSNHPNENYKPFAKLLLLEIARCLGITYEQLTGDREGATYSSERMGGAENWSIVLERRQNISGRLMQIAYEAWLEEDIELGLTEFPGGVDGFYVYRDLATLAEWRGPPKPTADDLKTANANQVKLANRIITREMWCAEEGVDWQDVDEQTAQEQQSIRDLAIEEHPTFAKPAGKFGEDPSKDGEKPPTDGEEESKPAEAESEAA